MRRAIEWTNVVTDLYRKVGGGGRENGIGKEESKKGYERDPYEIFASFYL